VSKIGSDVLGKRRIYIPPTTFIRKGERIYRKRHFKRDIGAPGRGKAIIPPLEEGELSKHLPEGYKDKPFFNVPAKVRRLALSMSVKEDGYRKVVGRLVAIQVLTKRTSPETARKAASDRRWLVKKFGGAW